MSEPDAGGDGTATDLKWVGPATAEALADADFSADDVRAKTVSYRMLVDAGVNPGVAAKIRREHSLQWSFEAGDGLDRRSTQVRGLGSEEAAWVAASSGDWEAAADEETETSPMDEGEAAWVAGAESADDDVDDAPDEDGEAEWVAAAGTADPAETDGSGDPVAAESAWRERSKPTPLTELDPVDETASDLLAEAGITSVRSLATADPEHVADVLDLDEARVRRWYDAARERYD